MRNLPLEPLKFSSLPMNVPLGGLKNWESTVLSNLGFCVSQFLKKYDFLYLFTAGKIDRVASETLAKVEEKCPIITKTPTEVSCLGILPFSSVSRFFGGGLWA